MAQACACEAFRRPFNWLLRCSASEHQAWLVAMVGQSCQTRRERSGLGLIFEGLSMPKSEGLAEKEGLRYYMLGQFHLGNHSAFRLPTGRFAHGTLRWLVEMAGDSCFEPALSRSCAVKDGISMIEEMDESMRLMPNVVCHGNIEHMEGKGHESPDKSPRTIFRSHSTLGVVCNRTIWLLKTLLRRNMVTPEWQARGTADAPILMLKEWKGMWLKRRCSHDLRLASALGG